MRSEQMMKRPDRTAGQLEGLTAVVTGAASGIGRQLAIDLHQRERCNLVLLDRDREGLAQLARLLGGSAASPTVSCHAVDLADSSALAAVARELQKHPIDLLINNAAVLHTGPLATTETEDFRKVVDTNLMAPVQLTKALLPQLLRSRRPFIVNVASISGLIGTPGICAYSTSKFGLVGFTEILRAELKGRVGVCVVCPSLVRTGIVSSAIVDETAPDRPSVMEALLRRVGAEPSKVSRAIIGSIKSRRDLVLVNLDAHLLYHLTRLAPRLGAMLVDLAYRWMRRRGIVG